MSLYFRISISLCTLIFLTHLEVVYVAISLMLIAFTMLFSLRRYWSVAVIKSQPGGNRNKAFVNNALSDKYGNIIDYTLWEDHGIKLLNHITINTTNIPAILIITHAWCKQNIGIFIVLHLFLYSIVLYTRSK